MRNIFLFIRRYFNFLFFLVLQILAITLLIKYSPTHQSTYAVIANEVTGHVNLQYNKVQYYFQLKETNRQLSAENARLRNMLPANFDNPDSSRVSVIDSLVKDTVGRMRRFIWLPAKVVSNTVSSQSNFLTLYRGSNQGIKKDMAVIGPTGLVGTVVEVSENYSLVMSLLHRHSKVSSMLKKGNIAGSVDWDGKDPNYLTLRNIPKSAQVSKGDSIVTSTYSANFPSDIMVGKVQAISADPSSNFFTIKIKTATNFFSIQYVNVVENLQWTEQRKLETTPLKNQ